MDSSDLDSGDRDRAEAYRILADIFSRPLDDEEIETIKQDFELDSRETEDRISADFQTLFGYPGGELPPLESLYVSGSDEAVARAADFYAKAELEISEDFWSGPEDHISLAFLFMSYLIEIGNEDLQEKFLDRHIMNWVPSFCDEVAARAATQFYREIAEVTKDFVESDYETVQQA